MKNCMLLLDYDNLQPYDFDNKVAKICFIAIKNLYEHGATQLTTYEVDQEIENKGGAAYQIYREDSGLDFLKASYEFAVLDNFALYYTRIKKYSLLRRLKKEGYSIDEYYLDPKNIDNPQQEAMMQQKFDDASLEDILNSVESKYNTVRNDFLNGGHLKGDPAEGIFELIENLKRSPDVGAPLAGDIFNTVCRGARQGCFYLKSASSSTGKSRTLIFDACKLAFPAHYSYDKGTFVYDVDENGELIPARKVLFIVTEMDKEELQTIILAYLSGVNETHILTGKYENNEEVRVRFAAKILDKYMGHFFIEEISEPNLVNVEATIKRYATVEHVKYVFFDYIHSTAGMINQFARSQLNEATILMLMANQLKQIAKDYNLFLFSATQVNINAMVDDGEFKNETSIRGSKSISDKTDLAYVMSKVNPKNLQGLIASWRGAVQAGYLDVKYITNPAWYPTHVLDIYKMRRGQYKNVRIWIKLDLGTGQRQDLFLTTANNDIIPINIIISNLESEIDWRKEIE